MSKINHSDLIVKMVFGSHLYGTATVDSDKDYKGIFMPSREQILLGKIPKCHNFTTGNGIAKNTKLDIDTEIYSLHYFVKLACDGQTVALDMLHAPDEMIICRSRIWDAIVQNRNKFYTKNLKSFINYARRQASKYGIKGSRLNDVRVILDILEQEDPQKQLQSVWEKLPRTDHCFDRESNPNGIRQYQVCGKIFQETAAIGYIIPILNKYHNEYGHRAKLAAGNKNVDWKAVSHALRAAYQTKEILESKTITFPLAQANFLKQVKLGKLDYLTEVAPKLESLMDGVEKLAQDCDLPSKVDSAFWDDFVCRTVEQTIFKIQK